MKKILIATAVAASFASVAHAQSSVTLYGTLDTSISYTSNVNGGHQWAVGSGSTDENRVTWLYRTVLSRQPSADESAF